MADSTESDFSSASVPPLSLSFWMEGAENTKLGKAAYEWFSRLGQRAAWAIDNRDPMTCDPVMLDLLAYERGIVRRGEPDRLYRLRVAHAYANAKDAGLTAGWRRIFERLELLEDGSEITQEERIPGQDWDIVGLFMSDERMSELQHVLERIIIEDYGRTCRRYRLVARAMQAIAVGVTTFDDEHCTVLAASAHLTLHRQGEIFA